MQLLTQKKYGFWSTLQCPFLTGHSTCSDITKYCEGPKTTNPAMAMSGLGHVRKGNKVLFYPNCIIHLTRAIYLQRLPRWRRARMAWWSDIKCRQKHRKDPSEWTNGLFVRTNGNEWRREWGSSFSPPHTHITFVSSTSRELSLPVRSSLQRSSYSTQESKR